MVLLNLLELSCQLLSYTVILRRLSPTGKGGILLLNWVRISKAWNPVQCVFQLFIFCNLSLLA